MNELTKFIRERAAEVEAAAEAAQNRFPGPWESADNTASPLPGAVTLYDSRDESVGVIRGSYAADHIGRHDPATALAEVALYRAIADAYERSVRMVGEGLSVPTRCLAVATAAIWAGHPEHVRDWPLGSARHR